MYHRTNVFCCKERSPQKKKYSNLKVRENKYGSRFYSAMISTTRKVSSSPFLSVVTVCVCERERELAVCLLLVVILSLQTNLSELHEPLNYTYLRKK